MGERYGKCRRCNGEGEIQKRDLVLHTLGKPEKCGTCEGTGFSGFLEDKKEFDYE